MNWEDYDPYDVDPDAPVESCSTCGFCTDPDMALIGCASDPEDEGTPCPECGWPYGSLRRAEVLSFAEGAERKRRRARAVTDGEETQ